MIGQQRFQKKKHTHKQTTTAHNIGVNVLIGPPNATVAIIVSAQTHTHLYITRENET